jgi:hypothetical protein
LTSYHSPVVGSCSSIQVGTASEVQDGGAALREALGDPILPDRITLDHRRAGLDERRAVGDEAGEAAVRHRDGEGDHPLFGRT